MIIWCVSKQNKLIIEGHGYGLGKYYGGYGYGGYGGGDGGSYGYFDNYYPFPIYVYDDSSYYTENPEYLYYSPYYSMI
jgi:hypothetical protein